MPREEIKTGLDYYLDEVRIESEKTGFSQNLSPLVSEINIFENISKPYLTGLLTINDNLDYLNQIDFSGTEKLRIRISVEKDDPDFTIEKRFLITEIESAVKSNDVNEVYTFKLVEDIGALSGLQRVSKSFNGRPYDIISNVAENYLNREVLFLPKNQTNPEPRQIKFISPNMTPIQIMSKIRDRDLTVEGMPYFLFSTLCDDRLRYIDLGTILKASPLNRKDYIYSQSFGSQSGDDDLYSHIDQSYLIQGYNISNKENQLLLAQIGAVGSTYNFIDTTSGNVFRDKFEIKQVMDELKENSYIQVPQDNIVYNEYNKIDDKPMHQYDASEVSSIGTSNIYLDNSYNYFESQSTKTHMLKARSKALKNFLHKSAIDINVPGRNFLYNGTNKSIGNIISIYFKNNLQAEDSRYLRDAKRSGNHMVYAARHVFSSNKYTVNLTCVKLSTEFMEQN